MAPLGCKSSAPPITPQDWGEVEAQAIYGKSIQAQDGATFTAAYDFGFMETALGAIVNQGLLVVAFHSTFKDDSGRHDYFNREFFYQLVSGKF